MCVTDRHDMTLAVKVALNPNITTQIEVFFRTRSIHSRLYILHKNAFYTKYRRRRAYSKKHNTRVLQATNSQPYPKQALVFMCLHYKSSENTVRKGEIARREQFLLFPQCFLPIWRTNFLRFSSNLKLLFADSLISEEPDISRLGKR